MGEGVGIRGRERRIKLSDAGVKKELARIRGGGGGVGVFLPSFWKGF